MKKVMAFTMGIVFMMGLTVSGCTTALNSKREEIPVAGETSAAEKEVDLEKLDVMKDKFHARITTEKGDIEFEFYAEDAPNTVKNFVTLAKEGFYDGLTFHRVVAGFVIQGGCPKGDGTGGPGYNINAEFNSRKHLDGAVAMARSQDPDSAGSQFYICLGPQAFLDGKYTVFGQVTKGMGVVKTIKMGDVMKKVSILKKK